jgi:hypothetical protein
MRTVEDIKISNLKRYHDNKEKYNQRQKKYFNDVWYPKNRERVLEYQRQYRQNKKGNGYKQIEIVKTELSIVKNITCTL